MDNRVISVGVIVAGLWWLSGNGAKRHQTPSGPMVHKRLEVNGYVITTDRVGGMYSSYLSDANGREVTTKNGVRIASKNTSNKTQALTDQDELSYQAAKLPTSQFDDALANQWRLGVNPIDKDEVAYLRQQLAKTHELVERAKRQITEARNAMDARDSALPGGRRPVVQKASPELLRAIDNLKNFDYSRKHFERELSLALQRNPVMRGTNLDKAEAKVRKLADAARGSTASPQSKAAYRRALDELMQLRIDAGTQATLFDVAPRQTTQRGLPGLFDNPTTPQYSSPKELMARSLDEDSRIKLYEAAPPEVSEKLLKVHAIGKRRYQLQSEFERTMAGYHRVGEPRNHAAIKREIQALNKEARKYPSLEALYDKWEVLTR